MKNILYICEGSGFAGAESYVLNLVSRVSTYNDINLSCALFYDGLLKEKLHDQSVKVFKLYGHKNLKSVGHIIRYIKNNRVELVHLVDLKSTVVGGIATIFLKSVKTIATVHGLPESYDSMFRRIKYGVSLLIYYFLLRFFVDRIICVSADLGSRLEKKVGSRKIRIIHNGLTFRNRESDFWHPRLQKHNFIVGTVGRLDRIKGHTFFLETALRIVKMRNDVVFHIVGTGPLERPLKEQAKLLGITDKVLFWGFQEDACALIEKMDIFVLSSLHEGIPYVLLEAMAFSKPVVCTNVGGIKEVIHDKVDGLLVPPKDPDALSRAILILLENWGCATELGRNARKKIETQFSSDLMAKETHDLYARLIKRL